MINFDEINFDDKLKSNKAPSYEDVCKLAVELNTKFDLVFGGSFGLKLYDKLRNRPISDIDLIFSSNHDEYEKILEYLDKKYTLSKESSGDNSEIKVIITYITNNNVKIDVVILKCDKINYNVIGEYKVHQLNEIIKAKQELILNNKHILDLNYILENLKY
jgi:hypothetical protein